MMNNRNALLRESLPAIARAMTRAKGIRLVFQGPPRTDGQTIYSNPLPIDADENQVKMIVGDIDHECGHILFTDFDYSRKAVESEPEDRRPLLFALCNAIEDTMIERRMGEEYLGCRTTLAESVEILEEQIEERVVSDDPGRNLANFIDCWGRVNVLHQQVEKSLEAATEAVASELGTSGVLRLEALLRQWLFSVDATEDSWRLAKEVEQFLESLEDDDQSQEDAGGAQGNGSSGESGRDARDTEGRPSSDTKPDDNPTSADAGSAGNSNAGGTLNAGAQAILQSQPDAKPLFDRRERADEAIAKASQSHYVPQDADSDFGTESDQRGGSGGRGGSLRIARVPGQYEHLRASIDSQITRLTRRIVQEYQTRTRRRWITSEAGRLDSRRLVQAHMGNRCVYRARQRQRLPYPAVGLVIDGSSSMSRHEMKLALQAAVVLAETNSALNVRTAIHAFAGDEVAQIKGYDQPLVQVREDLAGLCASGGTPMDDALWRAGCAVARQREKRKLLFLLTDGKPNDPSATKEISDMLQRSGIEVIGIGIRSEAVEQYTSHASVVSDAEQVAAALLSALRTSIVQAA